MSKGRVFAAMSGGVDSSVSAALLKQMGYEVSGVHMQLSHQQYKEEAFSRLERTCQLLNIPLHKLNLEKEFQDCVVNYFCREYSGGLTPNPCVVCNNQIKFGTLLDRVRQMGAEYLATGHYARVEPTPDGYLLLRGKDLTKDQSYFLYTLGQEKLRYVLFPVGGFSKEYVKGLARQMGLPAVESPESQDICFIPDDYRVFLAGCISFKPGDIVDTEGKVLGKHNGLANYTVGQRQGLGISSESRLYVLELDAENNRLIAGSEDKLFKDRILAGKLHWLSGKASEKPVDVTVKIRYKAPEAAATVTVKDNIAEVQLHKPQRAISPGQSVVFYQGDIVLGGGVIQNAS